MKKELKFFVIGVIVSAIGATFVASNFSITPSVTSVSPDEGGTSISYYAKVCKTVTRADGTVEDLGCSSNLFTDGGRNATRDSLVFVEGTTVTNFQDIAVANKTGAGCPAAQATSDTTLCGEYSTVGGSCGMGRSAVANTFTRINASGGPNSGNWSVGGEFTANAACDVNATGLFNDTTTGAIDLLFAENTFTTASLAANDKINVTWFIWVL